MDTPKSNYYKFSGAEKLIPQEEMLEVNRSKSTLTIGVPKEISFQENRIPLAPQAVGLLIANGHKVLIETKAGESANFSDEKYSDVGAEIVYSKEKVFEANLIIKVAPLMTEETELLRAKQTIISSLHIAGQKRKYFEDLMAKRITAIGYEFIKDKTGSFPVIRFMSEIVGNASIFIAAKYLEDIKYGKGSLFGGFPGLTPTEVVILGSGAVAEFAARAALGHGALVKVFDNSIYKLRRLQSNLNTRISTSIIQPLVLQKALKTADVVIGAIHSSEGMSPCLVTEDMVRHMPKGSVIIDVSIDQGGCFETSKPTNHNEPIFVKNDVIHYCVPNIASRVPHTASYALSNFFTPILLRMGEEGGIENLLRTDFGLRKGAYLFNGTLTKPYLGNHFDLPYQDIELLIAAFRT